MKFIYQIDKMLTEECKTLHDELLDSKLTDEECPDKKFVIFWNGIMDKFVIINKDIGKLPAEMYPISQLIRFAISLSFLVNGKDLLDICDQTISFIKDAIKKLPDPEEYEDESTPT